MDNLDIYKCNICGNIIQILSVGGGELICCGSPMEKLEPKTNEEAMTEKHVPVLVEYENGEGEVRVGEILHPMTDEHYIMFIQVISSDKKYVQQWFLHPNDIPKVYLKNVQANSFANEYCNIHGLWQSKNVK